MADDFVAGVGPLFGPDFVEVVANDDTGRQYTLQIYPDAHNPQLKAAGLPTQYYFQPQRVYLAKKETSPADFDFGMTVFKGLATGETTLGMGSVETVDGAAESGGGFCSFTTTFAIPDSVLAHAVEKLKSGDHTSAAERIATYFNYEPGAPEPRLGLVPVAESSVTIAVPDLIKATDGTRTPMYISAQSTGKGSIEQHGYCSFLVTCNQFAAGAIAGSLTKGVSPFVVTNNLKEMFYVNGITATVHVDVDKVYDSFSAAGEAGFGWFDSISASYAWSECLTNGDITTEIEENGTALDPKLKDWVEQKVEDMRKAAMEVVKAEIFDWDPGKTDSQATADRGWWSSVFGGASVSLKADHQRRGIKYDQTIILNETISVDQAVSGDLNDLEPAVKANLGKYLAIVDIGQYFQKVQVAATCAVNFSEKLPDGTELRDPIVSVQLEAGYPDYNDPQADGKPNLRVLGQGFHYTLTSKDPKAAMQPAIWTADNPKDIVSMSWLRLDDDLDGWPKDQVMLRRRLVYDGDDPRVNLSSAVAAPGGGMVVAELVEPATTDHVPVLTVAQVGYVFVRFKIRDLPKSNITVTITPTIGTDTYPPVVVTRANLTNALWEVFSDKYFDVDSISLTISVDVSGPNFTDDPVTYSTEQPVTVPVPKGRIKYLSPLPVALPKPPPDKVDVINQYIHDTAG
ncbi:hypothetical protein [Actinocrispum wychmicini]|uniref:Uncharacterized protein n=1 Tax=Actinocrispum wychmicini TaxID=1213861 RepID=A0A4R2JZP1_9PSEU|nr:hypothetical protein [Actinocrispum wychmicini]TCO62918.1 hypothetical protein EV192_1021058 [Actinocrispum wychmicini]